MQSKLVIGIAGGALALALAGGAVLASPAAQESTVAQAQATATPAPKPSDAGPRARQAMAKRLVLLLSRATADVSGVKPREVLAGLRDGKSLAQIAQEHGKTDKDVIAAARAKLDEQLKQAVAKSRLTQVRADTLLSQFDQAAPQVVSDQDLGQKARRAAAKKAPVAAELIKATAEVTGLKPKDVLAELRAGKSLVQIAQEHGKTGDDIMAKLRELSQQQLDKGLDRAKELIDKPGLGRDQQPAAEPTRMLSSHRTELTSSINAYGYETAYLL
jgi:uncharacterized protein (DUF433 family)